VNGAQKAPHWAEPIARKERPMSNRHILPSGTDSTLFVPLNRLKKSPRNVRKIPHAKSDIAQLAASIAAHGLLQNFVVEAEHDAKGKPTGDYLVTAGEGRRLALMLRAKRKEIADDEPVRCVLGTADTAIEASLAENAVRAEMHPADQYEAFARLQAEQGLSAEDIAARFGVSATLVRQRLKLGAVSPKLQKLFRKDEMTLEQLTAFAITDDHTAQERVWRELPEFSRSRGAILRALAEGQVSTDDRRARFVGADAYQAAGGVIVHDLFGDEGDGFFADAALLGRLVREKLDDASKAIAAEGWKWVAADAELDYEVLSDMRRVYPVAAKLTQAEKKRLRKLQARSDALVDKHDGMDMPEAAEAQYERLQQQIAKLDRLEYKPKDLALAGAVVTLDQDGELRIERGLVRPEDAPQKSTKKAKADASADEANAPQPLSEKLDLELHAYLSVGLRETLATHPDVALTATVHALASSTFFPHGEPVTCLDLRGRSAYLAAHAPGIDESAAGRAIAARHAAWEKKLPRDPARLWTLVRGMPETERLELLAHCAALTIDVVQSKTRSAEQAMNHASALASEVALDMAAYWQPTPESYLGRVSKERILEAVREACGEAAARSIAGLKKTAMAETVAKLLDGKRWLPPLLRTPA
jgi:ParB family chromosome partitioning protein